MTTIERKYERVKGALVVGVDVSKKVHEAAFYQKGEGVIKRTKFNSDLQGFQQLSDEVDAVCREIGIEKVILGVEPTGHYWKTFGYWWEDHRGEMVLVNPLHTKRAKELDDNSPLKTDPKDARVIAWLISEARYLECRLPRGEFATLEDLVQVRERYGNLETQLVNQLHQMVDLVFPEINQVFANFMTVSSRRFLAKYADPKDVARVSSRKLEADLRKWSRGQFKPGRAQQLIELAKTSSGLQRPALINEIKALVGQLGSIGDRRKSIDKEIKSCLKGLPGADLLLTIPGFGNWTVAVVLSRTGDLRNYEHPRQLIKLAGLNLYEMSSGAHKGRLRISKRGNSLLRKALYMAALRACKKKSQFHPYYERLTKRGKAPVSTLVALMRKLLRISWALCKKQETFDVTKLMPSLALAA